MDSVALMRVARRVGALAGVEAAALMIGTPANKAMLRDSGLLESEAAAASANDLILAVRASEERVALNALESAQEFLSDKPVDEQRLPHVRTLAGALDLLPGANLALISVPGEFAAQEARKALERGLHVFLFSDNVAIDEEVKLKRLANDKGLFFMGPDCGTALIAGTPLGFANAVPRGEIGIVSASGTGLQEVSTLIARLGGGISQGIGVGGRDLDARVGGLATLVALEALESDAGTAKIVLISKPPAPEIAERVLERVRQLRKPVIPCFLDTTLREAAERAMNRKIEWTNRPSAPKRRGKVIGLYCGGTLCSEAERIVRSRGAESAFTDLGEDRYTRGRPHPMIEPELRNEHLKAALSDLAVSVILVDVVLGYGAHEDPAGVLVEALRRNDKIVIASVTGTDADPQNRSRQVAILENAGVIVAPSNAHAAELAAELAG
jgi:FdrA protein